MSYRQIYLSQTGKKEFFTVLLLYCHINTVFYAFSYRAIGPSSNYSCMHSTNILSKNIPLVSGDTSCWLGDDQFSRQALAGINPLAIERL